MVAAIDGDGHDEGSSLVSAGSGEREGGREVALIRIACEVMLMPSTIVRMAETDRTNDDNDQVHSTMRWVGEPCRRFILRRKTTIHLLSRVFRTRINILRRN